MCLYFIFHFLHLKDVITFLYTIKHMLFNTNWNIFGPAKHLSNSFIIKVYSGNITLF